MDLQTLIDRAEITDLVTRYVTAVDRRNWDLYRSVFTDDAHIDYTAVGGIAGSVEEMCSWLNTTLGMFEACQHLVSNFDIAVDGDQATATVMVFNSMQLPNHPVWATGGWYHHKLVRTPQGWRSRELTEEASWFKGFPKPQPKPKVEVES